MSKKVVISAAQRLAQLKVLPQDKLPSTLKTQIKLPNIKQVRLSYRPMCKNVGPSLQFVRKYGPALRFYNPGLQVIKKQDQSGPITMVMQIVKKNFNNPIVIVPNQFKTPEQILQQIKKIDAIN